MQAFGIFSLPGLRYEAHPSMGQEDLFSILGQLSNAVQQIWPGLSGSNVTDQHPNSLTITYILSFVMFIIN